MSLKTTDKKEFIEGLHYILEQGRVVFTSLYLYQRGYCCGNNCRNCPYIKPSVKGTKQLDENYKYLNNDNKD
jgi:hypothetical protein